MKRLLISALLLAGCGDGSSDDSDIEVTPAPITYPYSCVHKGNVLICLDENSCIRDESITETEQVERGLWKTISIGGNVTIIAECGAEVNLSLSESVQGLTE